MNTEKIKKLREEIDEIDSQIIELISRRMNKVKDVGVLKKLLNLPPLDMNRFREVLNSRIELAEKAGLPRILIESLWNIFHEEALEIEKNA